MISVCKHILESNPAGSLLFVDSEKKPNKVLAAMCESCQPRFNEFKPLCGLDAEIARQQAATLGIPSKHDNASGADWYVKTT